MKNSIIMSLITAGMVWIPWVFWVTIRTYILAQPDSKFGDLWGIYFVAVLWGAAAIIAGLSSGIVRLLLSLRRASLSPSREKISALLSGLLLAVAAKYLPRLPPIGERLIGEIPGIVLCWVVICLVVCAEVQALVLLGTPNQAL